MPLPNRVCFQVNLRDGLKCRMCGLRPKSEETYHQGFQYHHVTPRSLGGADTVENIVLLCRPCHHKLHSAVPEDLLNDDALNIKRDASLRFNCKQCGAALDAGAVEMNCGWYRCSACLQTTHLYRHCCG